MNPATPIAQLAAGQQVVVGFSHLFTVRDVVGLFGDASLSLLYSCADVRRTQADRLLEAMVNRA
jgi:hypothetical protein